MQVAKKLRCGIWTEELGRLDLDHELLVDDHVECVTSERFAAEKGPSPIPLARHDGPSPRDLVRVPDRRCIPVSQTRAAYERHRKIRSPPR